MENDENIEELMEEVLEKVARFAWTKTSVNLLLELYGN